MCSKAATGGGEDQMSGWTGPGWSEPAKPLAQVALRFGGTAEHEALNNISAGTRIGGTLFSGRGRSIAASFASLWPGRWVVTHLRARRMPPARDAERRSRPGGLAADEGCFGLWAARPHPRKPEKERAERSISTKLGNSRTRAALPPRPAPTGRDAGWLAAGAATAPPRRHAEAERHGNA
jgi:hypothetical protein